MRSKRQEPSHLSWFRLISPSLAPPDPTPCYAPGFYVRLPDDGVPLAPLDARFVYGESDLQGIDLSNAQRVDAGGPSEGADGEES